MGLDSEHTNILCILYRDLIFCSFAASPGLELKTQFGFQCSQQGAPAVTCSKILKKTYIMVALEVWPKVSTSKGLAWTWSSYPFLCLWVTMKTHSNLLRSSSPVVPTMKFRSTSLPQLQCERLFTQESLWGTQDWVPRFGEVTWDARILENLWFWVCSEAEWLSKQHQKPAPNVWLSPFLLCLRLLGRVPVGKDLGVTIS